MLNPFRTAAERRSRRGRHKVASRSAGSEGGGMWRGGVAQETLIAGHAGAAGKLAPS